MVENQHLKTQENNKRRASKLLFVFLSLALVFVKIYIFNICDISIEKLIADVFFISPALFVVIISGFTMYPASSFGASLSTVLLIDTIASSACDTSNGGASMVEIAWFFLAFPCSLIGFLVFYILFKFINLK
jgi:hypothetical protein